MRWVHAMLRLFVRSWTASRDKSLREWRGGVPLSQYPGRGYDDEEAARKAVEVVEEYTMVSYARLVTLWQQVRYLDRAGIPGCLVECGTWKGGASGMMALAHLAGESPFRYLHLFDSFEGLPEPRQDKDGADAIVYAKGRASGRLKSIGRCVGALEDNRRLLGQIIGYPAELTCYHVGWFHDTVPVAARSIGPIALLRLDGDWYDSTRTCLEELCPLVSPGGIVVIDDYGKWSGCRKAVDEFMGTLPRPLLLNHIDAAGRYWIVPDMVKD